MGGSINAGEDDYAGSYFAACDGATGKDVIFGGASLDKRELRIYGTLKIESGEAVVRIRTNWDLIELMPNQDGFFETNLRLTDGGNYIMVAYQAFSGTIELYSEPGLAGK